MKILGTISEVLSLPEGLSQFISTTSPWIHDNWDPEQIGWIFVLDDNDLESARSLNITPHNMDAPLIIDLDEFDLFEFVISDPETDYWNLVAIVGQEYGFSVFLPNVLTNQLPNLRRQINHLI
jgi:hypothetical protein